MNSRTARSIQRNPVLKNQPTKQTKTQNNNKTKQKNSRKKIYWLTGNRAVSREAKAESQGRNLEAGADAETMEGCCLLTCSASSLREPRTTSPEMDPPTMGWVLPHQSLINKTLSGQEVVAHVFNSSTWEAEPGRFLSSRSAWSTK